MAGLRVIWRWVVIALVVAAVVPLVMPAGAAAPKFPTLTGRVVDDARILSEDTRRRLSQMLEAFERDTKRQVVVATIADLQGYPIEEYGYQLGRHWGIGEKGKNTGAILLVAPKDRQVRIEVGYGLEGELTDAVARQILDQFVLPHIRAGNLDAGVVNGTLAMLRALGWQGGQMPQTPRQRPQASAQDSAASFFLPFVVFFLLFFVMGRRRGWSGGSYPGGIYRAGGPFRGGGFGGGFRGGGGSFGGGGASGRW